MVKLINYLFDQRFVAIVTGGIDVSQQLLAQNFDYIFFTGSSRVGQIVMEQASKKLIPMTLELGGKSPVIVDASANLKHAANRIAWGRFVNAGQTCVAPDFVLVQRPVYEQFLKHLKQTVEKFYGKNAKTSPDFGRVVNEQHAKRLQQLIQDNHLKVIHGGETDPKNNYIAPTIFRDVSIHDTLMEEELFGPLLPIIPYDDPAEIDTYLRLHPKPLALYIFSENKKFAENILRRYPFGGGCLNDTISHVGSFNLPFGGVGPSGIGRYHGLAGFKTFTYEKSIVKKSSKIPMNLLLPPYKNKAKLLKRVIK